MEHAEKLHPDILLQSRPFKNDGKKIIAIGASTGGVEAVAKVIAALPKGLPPIVITQHIPGGFSSSFAHRLDSMSDLIVQEVSIRMLLKDSNAYIAPGGKHLLIDRGGVEYYGKPLDGERISRHRPSVDVMFRSVNNAAGKNCLAIIMTGMGDDGAIGIKELHSNGAYTIAQDESSCVVFGMPKQAIAKGAICEIVHLDDIASKIIQFSQGLLKRN